MTVKSAELKVFFMDLVYMYHNGISMHQAGKKNAIEVSTKENTYYMYADTEKEKDDWIGAIGRFVLTTIFRTIPLKITPL